MKYIKEQPFLDRRENQVVIPSRDASTNDVINFEPTLRWVLSVIANSYTPTQTLTLTLGEIRFLNRVLNILEDEEKSEEEYLAFEDEEFAVLKKIVISLLPQITISPILMNAPQVEDILNAPLDKTPKKGKKDEKENGDEVANT